MPPLAAPLIAFFLSVLATLAAANAGLSLARLPSYATWTGVATLERKLELYREFAAAGPVDLLLFGDSCPDHGVSAELLTQDLSRYYGRPYRVFNFSTGAGGNRTFPLVYRLLRTVANPKQIAYRTRAGGAAAPRIIRARRSISCSTHRQARRSAVKRGCRGRLGPGVSH